MEDFNIAELSQTPAPSAAASPAPWDFSTYGQWRAASAGDLDKMWGTVEGLQPGAGGYFGLSASRLQEAGNTFGLTGDQLLQGIFDLQKANGRNTADTWNLNPSAGGFLAPAYIAGMAYKQLGLPEADKVMQAASAYQHGPWNSYVNNVQEASSKAAGGSDLGDFLKVAAPIALMAMGVPDFFSGLTGGTAMGTELGGIADAMNLGYGAGGVPVQASWLGSGMEGLAGAADAFGGGSAWDSLVSQLSSNGWDYLPGVLSGEGTFAGAPVTNLDRPYMDWGRPDMGSTFANWLDNPLSALKKLRAMSPMASRGGPLQSGWNILSGLHGISQSRQLADLASKASERADPFGPYRAGYARQLAALSANPSLITKQPGYAAGLEAVRRSLAAQGYQGSGNMMAALSQYGQKFLGDEQNRLATLAGAGFNPAAAGQLNIEGNVAANQLLFTALNRLGGGLWQALS